METYRKEDIRRGDIYYADLRPVVGSEQGGIRPVVILQNNVGNRHSPTVIAAAITSRKGKHKLPRVYMDTQFERAQRCNIDYDKAGHPRKAVRYRSPVFETK